MAQHGKGSMSDGWLSFRFKFKMFKNILGYFVKCLGNYPAKLLMMIAE